MKITDKLLTVGNAHGRIGTKMKPKGIVVHYVGNPGSTAAGNRNWFENGAGGNYTSAHYIIGLDGEILRCIPETECAQHAGRSYAAKYNAQAALNNGMYIGIENCHPDATGKFNDKTYAALVGLCADICKRYGFDPAKDIFRHYDVTGKSCPVYYVNNGGAWSQFLKDVNESLNPAPISSDAPTTTVCFDLPDGNVIDVPGFLKNGFNYIQARALLEAMGFVVWWENNTFMVRVKRQISEPDYSCLCKITEAEAGGEDEKGKVLVCNTIFNRMADKGFPDNLQDIVFQSKTENGVTIYQFSPIGATAYAKAIPSNATKLAVDKALCGADYSQGALFFCSLESAKNPASYHENYRQFLFQHGGHRFYR